MHDDKLSEDDTAEWSAAVVRKLEANVAMLKRKPRQTLPVIGPIPSAEVDAHLQALARSIERRLERRLKYVKLRATAAPRRPYPRGAARARPARRSRSTQRARSPGRSRSSDSDSDPERLCPRCGDYCIQRGLHRWCARCFLDALLALEDRRAA